MKMILSFDSVDEFSLFITSTAALDFGMLPQVGVNLERFLPPEAYWPFLARVSEVRVADVVYTVTEDLAGFQSAEYRVVNYMLNDVQVQGDSIWILMGDEESKGSNAVREFIQALPKSFGLRVGWRTDYLEYVFTRQ